MAESNRRRAVLFFSGTSQELRAFLAQIDLLTRDDAYEWELTASMSRHPAGKRLRTVDAPCDRPGCHDLPAGMHHVSCALHVDEWRAGQ